MVSVVTDAEARADLDRLIENVGERGETQIITRESGKAVVVIAIDEWIRLIGSADPRATSEEGLTGSIAQLDRGEVVETSTDEIATIVRDALSRHRAAAE